jgi:hypothetical protein
MDPAFLAMLMEYILSQQTSGNQSNPGGDRPYDDYGLQDTIGGLGAIDPNAYSGGGEPSVLGGMSDAPSLYDTSPSTVGFYGPQARIEQRQPLADLLMAMQQGRSNGTAPHMQGLFGGGVAIERPYPSSPAGPSPVAAPVAGPVSGPPRGTPTPNPRTDPSTLPNPKDRVASSKTLPSRAAPQAIASTGRTYRSASQPAQAVQAAQFIARLAGSNPPMQQSFPKPATQRPQSPAPKPALADFTAPRPARLDKPPVRYQSSGFSKPSTRR